MNFHFVVYLRVYCNDQLMNVHEAFRFCPMILAQLMFAIVLTIIIITVVIAACDHGHILNTLIKMGVI